MIRFEKAKVEIVPKKIVLDLTEANFWGLGGAVTVIQYRAPYIVKGVASPIVRVDVDQLPLLMVKTIAILIDIFFPPREKCLKKMTAVLT